VTAAPTGLPSISDVVAELRRATGESESSSASGLLGLLLELHRNNVVQWNREDVARRDSADDRAVAAAKRDIDALNTMRHELVEAIDAELAAGFDQDPAAPPATESPAMVFDRLSVLVIRRCFTEEAASSQRGDRDLYLARLPRLDEQLSLLQAGLEALFDDVRTGRKRFLPYQSLKLYGSVATRDTRDSS
jgi:Protein of unknown function (DUF4254)